MKIPANTQMVEIRIQAGLEDPTQPTFSKVLKIMLNTGLNREGAVSHLIEAAYRIADDAIQVNPNLAETMTVNVDFTIIEGQPLPYPLP